MLAQIYQTDPRSDSFDISHISLQLDLSDMAAKTIRGNANIDFKSKVQSLQRISLDLLKMTIDSVKFNGVGVIWQYNDTLLRIELSTALQSGDSAGLQIAYHGQPVLDNTGWGGFYFQGNYAYNLGVGFGADPHPYGRVWFPCLDNFTERFSMEQFITTQSGYSAVCGGLLIDTLHRSNGNIIWHWKLDEAVPSYLQSVAVAPYAFWKSTYKGIQDTVPIMIAGIAADTGKIAGSFAHLQAALHTFENAYGPYRWPRVGYVLVPFNSGAMEHATNIAYPRAVVNGQSTYESLFAHELSHHWWGDLVTCRTAEDMWISEGWASYSEYLFYESVYGRQRYDDEIRMNHKTMLQTAHVDDNGWLPVSGIGHDYTYGTTVYSKGSDMIHNLRGYLGDSLFFHCIKGFLTNHAYSEVSSIDLRDYLSQCSGIDLSDFFNDWIFQPGWLHFSIDSVVVHPFGSQFKADVYIRQRLNHASHYGNHIPLTLTFLNSQWKKIEKQVDMSGRCGIYHVLLPYNPPFIALNMDQKINDAVSAQTLVIKTPGIYKLEEAMMDITLNSLQQDSILLRVSHHWVAPDPFINPHPGLHLSPNRYWKVDGLFSGNLDAVARIRYNGTHSHAAGYLDNELITNSEDSLLLMYRAKTGDEWTEYPDYQINTLGSALNKFGLMDISPLRRGEYTLAIRDHNRPDTLIVDQPNDCQDLNTSLPLTPPVLLPSLQVTPNPGKGNFMVEMQGNNFFDDLFLYDSSGTLLWEWALSSRVQLYQFDLSQYKAGTYFLKADYKGVTKATAKFVILP